MPQPADLVVRAARVVTWDPDRPDPVTAVAVRGDRIVAIGAEEAAAVTGPRTEVVTGGMVLPGFQDAHVHAPFAGHDLLRVWLHDLEGRDAYLAHLAGYAAAHPDAAWIVGGGWAMEHFPGGTPTKEDLDAVVPDRPVFLFNRDVHGAWVNSRALAVAGIDRHTPDPADGRIERDPLTGDPTGTLHEGAAYTFNDRFVPRPGRADWEEAILVAQRHLHSLGITGWQDAWVTPDTQAAYQSLAKNGELTARVVGALWWDRHRGLEQVDELVHRRATGGAGGFHPTSVKIMADGVMENYTGALLEPYCDGCGGQTDNRGLSYVDRDLLVRAVTALDDEGFQVHMHAIGDRAVRDCLDAVAAARAAHGPNDLRHHIAHLQLVQPADLPRFAELGVVANCQAYWAQSEPQMDELTVPFLGEERARLQFPFADLVRHGALLAMGSDWAVTTADPLPQVEVAVTRTDPSRRGSPPFLPHQALDVATALRAFTAGSAFVNHDDDAGVLRVGARADLAVLDTDLLDGTDVLPTDARVTLTVASGRVVHRS
ncbi:amidohydrolase [Nocardioides antri]|uniref:Amidohydrolase n=1 Tax=Nocardioides antri TaxID=2607659 RepID=A0A5B1M9V0_9ACTN|nr:amidohydrolase [Nocardioides antri]KAA1429226.1 amidohydrolase [Nocardioides antri]